MKTTMSKSSLQGMKERGLWHQLYVEYRNHFVVSFLYHRIMSTAVFAQVGWENKSQESAWIIWNYKFEVKIDKPNT